MKLGHASMLKLPIFGRLNLLVAVARFSRTLATLLASGVALLQAMDIVKNVLEQRAARDGGGGRDRLDPRGREHRRAAEAERPVPADRHAHDRRRREERAARADAENVADAYDADVETRVQR